MKQMLMGNSEAIREVAPRTGAWIETPRTNSGRSSSGSPPARGRGLKRLKCPHDLGQMVSPPARGRGLKHIFAGRRIHPPRRRPPHGGVD